MQAASLNHFKSIFAHQFFVRPADQNYFLARWTRINGFADEFFWQSLQAIEKYIKASLITNDIPAPSSHNLGLLYAKHEQVFKDLALRSFVKPEALPGHRWRDESVTAFVKRIGTYGAPDSRYGLISWHHTSSDLFKLDQLVFSLRRLTIGLHWVVGADWQPSEALLKFEGRTFQEVLQEQADIQMRGPVELPSMPANIAGEHIGDALYSWNFCLARSSADLERPAPVTVSPRIGPLRNSYLHLLHEYLNTPDSQDDPYLIEGIRWLIFHVPLQKEVVEAFKKCIS